MLNNSELWLVCCNCRNLVDNINYMLNGRVFELDGRKNIAHGIGTYVTPYDETRHGYHRYTFSVFLDLDDVESYATANDIDVISASKLLVSHEIFHVLLDHFNPKYRKLNKKLFNIAADLEVNSYINAKSPALRAADYGMADFMQAKEYYDRMAKDAQKQQQSTVSIAIPVPANSESSDNSQSPTLGNQDDTTNGTNSTEQSSEQCTNAEDKQSENTTQNMNTTDDVQSSNGDTHNDENEQRDLSNDDLSNGDDNEPLDGKHDDTESSGENDDNKPSDETSDTTNNDAIDELAERLTKNKLFNSNTVEIDDATADKISQLVNAKSIGIGSVARIGTLCKKETERQYTKESSTIDGLDELVKKMVRKESAQAVSPHKRTATYMKLNNRRRNGDIILPGTRFDGDGVRKKFNTSLTVFVDVSGSTSNIIRQLNTAAYKLYKVGATIVYYDDRILDTVKPNERFRIMDSHGGTNIVEVLNEYLADPTNKLERAYIITDGSDYFKHVNDVVDKYNIYRISNNRIREIYSDKNPCTHNYSG